MTTTWTILAGVLTILALVLKKIWSSNAATVAAQKQQAADDTSTATAIVATQAGQTTLSQGLGNGVAAAEAQASANDGSPPGA